MSWKLIDKNRLVVAFPYACKNFRDEDCVITGGKPPVGENSEGHVWESEYGPMHYPSAYGLKWIETSGDRTIRQIAREISQDWKKVNFGAVPYLRAMHSLEKVTDMYGCDDAKGIIAYFLCNASTWRGETAKRIKKELKELIK